MSDKTMSLVGHLVELRRALIASLLALFLCSVAAYVFYPNVIELLERPLRVLRRDTGESFLYVTTVFEGFLTRMRVSVVAGLLLSFPAHLFNLARFIFPGLDPREKRAIVLALLASFLLIVPSAFFGYSTIVPLSVAFLTGAGFVPADTGLLLSFSASITYVLQFMLATLVIFQIPILLEILMAVRLLERRTLVRIGRYVVVLIFALAAVVTPPDFLSQLAVALPLTALYYLALLVARVFRLGER